MTALLPVLPLLGSRMLVQERKRAPGVLFSPQQESQSDRDEQVRIAKSLAALPEATEIEVFLLPSADSRAEGAKASTVRRVFKREDPKIAPLLSALAKSQKDFPHGYYKWTLCSFHADALIRPSKGEQVALCFGCHVGAVTSLSQPDATSIRKAKWSGGWDLGDAKKIAAELTVLFPGESFPRRVASK